MAALLDLSIDRARGPAHTQIVAALTAAVASGELAAGTRLPPERTLAGILGVSRMTVRQALGTLERDGIVRRVVGRAGGTFVQEPKVERHPARIAGLSAELRRQGLAAAARVVSAGVRPARPRSAAALGLPAGAPALVIARVRLASGTPLASERSTLPARLFPGLERLPLDGSLYDLMGERYGRRPVRARERLETVAARPVDAEELGVAVGAPLLLVERVAYAADGTPVEFARDRFRGDRTRIVIESTEVDE